MPVLSGKTNFDPFLKTSKIFALKSTMKYSKSGYNSTMLKIWHVTKGFFKPRTSKICIVIMPIKMMIFVMFNFDDLPFHEQTRVIIIIMDLSKNPKFCNKK